MAVTLEKPKKKHKLEKVIQKEIVDYLNSLDSCSADVITVSQWIKRGMADIIGCYRGRYLAIEVKRPSGKATLIQTNWLNKKKECGGITGVATSVKEVMEILKREK